MSQQLPRRFVFALIASIPVFFVAPAWSATVVIESTFVNTSTNQLTITGSDFKPSSSAPKVNLDNNVLVLVSSTNTKIVATLSAGLHTGYLYHLGVTNSVGSIGASTVTIPGPGQIYTGTTVAESNINGSSATFPSSLTAVISGQTIMLVACTVDVLYASITPYFTYTTPPYVTLGLQQNSQDTSFPTCQVSSATPTSCPLPTSPISVSVGDTLNYVVTVPGTGSGQIYYGMLNLALQCQ
jgi:hypothetical protein